MRTLALCISLLVLMDLTLFSQTGGTGRRRASPPSIRNNDAAPSKRREPTLDDTRVKPGAASDRSKPAAAVGDDDVITVDTNLVTTPVSVLDRNGRFIAGLKRKDFKIFEEGVQQKITYFQSEEQPFTVVLMIDTSPSTRFRIDDIHYAAITFVNQLRPNDKVMVIAFDQRARVLAEPTSDRKELYSAIYRAQFGSGTGLYDAVAAVAGLDMLNVLGRKAVVIFTDGVDTTSRRASFESTVAAVEEIDALFYTIRYDTQRSMDQNLFTAAAPGMILPPGIQAQLPPGAVVRLGRGQSAAEYAKGRDYLVQLSENSGGRMFDADSITDLEASFSGVAEELRRQYSVGYYPESTGEPGERRRIKIQVSRPKAVVRAKPSYVIRQMRDAAAEPSGSAF